MGNILQTQSIPANNYFCPKCTAKNELPNAAGRFFIINDKQCQCNGCGTIYDKTIIYKPVDPLTGRPVSGYKVIPVATPVPYVENPFCT